MRHLRRFLAFASLALALAACTTTTTTSSTLSSKAAVMADCREVIVVSAGPVGLAMTDSAASGPRSKPQPVPTSLHEKTARRISPPGVRCEVGAGGCQRSALGGRDLLAFDDPAARRPGTRTSRSGFTVSLPDGLAPC